jgi:AcrR family transcriptional regulator
MGMMATELTTGKAATTEDERRGHIVIATLAEFTQWGYQQASTNRIARQAGVSKGLLFHYFGNKRLLFEHCVEYAIATVRLDYLERLVLETPDFVERQRCLSRLKYDAVIRNPEVFGFMSALYLNVHDDDLGQSARDFIASMTDFYQHTMREGIDEGLFRKDIAPAAAIRYIIWLLDGFERQLEATLRTQPTLLVPSAAQDELWDEFNVLLDDIRALFYRKEKP